MYPLFPLNVPVAVPIPTSRKPLLSMLGLCVRLFIQRLKTFSEVPRRPDPPAMFSPYVFFS